MPTQEERLFNLEQVHKDFSESLKDLNHYVTMAIGIVGKQELDIREIKISLRSIDDRLTSFEESVNSRFEALEQNVNGLHGRFDHLEKLLLDRLPPA